MTISKKTINAMTSSLVVTFVLPVLAVFFVLSQGILPARSLFGGIAVYIIAQVVFRVPLIKHMKSQPWFDSLSSKVVIYSFILALSAGLFEEIGRFIAMTYLLSEPAFSDGVAFGFGHGVIESILLVGFAQLNNIVYSSKINQGLFARDVAPRMSKEGAAETEKKLIETTGAEYYAGAVERILAIIIHIGLSTIVLQAAANRDLTFLGLAILLHTAIDTPVLFLKLKGTKTWLVLPFMFIAGILLIALGMKIAGML